MKFAFTGICELVLTHTPGDTTSRHESTNINLEVSKNLDNSMYLAPNKLPTKEGARVMLKVFINGTVGAILNNHFAGYQDKKEGLALAIAQLTELVERDDSAVNSSLFENL